ncbi:hypothetical protein DESME_15390 [Desulfitobacterium metallireducens DSM 15288]|uniref:Uncharacterized protein n=2 Tax=Desulfitobacterium TaxID=36853 RepID=W0EHP1_9FIRM|nr:hypothetical protein DESME_15390 [Desulfitobacterium metallireducens DSM 15288]
MGETLDRGSKARDNNVRSLAFFLGFSVLAHGIFFPQEWLWLGAGLAFVLSWEAWKRVEISELHELKEIQITLSITDGLLFILIGLSLLGLYHPVKRSEGLLDAIRWGILWMVYHQSREIPKGLQQEKMLSWIEGIGAFLAILAWIRPLSLWVQGQGLFLAGTQRLSSLLGYPNALGVYLATVLLLRPHSKIIQALLFLSLLSTGSRAAVFLFLMVWSIRGLIRWRVGGILSSVREGIFIGILIISGLLLTWGLNPGALHHLFDWGIQNSIGERLLYIRDGLRLAWAHQGMPQAGGWLAFPIAQNIPYWTTDPHSTLIRVLLNQGVYGVLAIILWTILIFKKMAMGRKYRYMHTSLLTQEGGNRRQEIFSALLFLILHSMIDVDFLFGTLGILFSILLGIFLTQQAQVISPPYRVRGSRINDLKRHLIFKSIFKKNLLAGLLFLFSALALLGAWVYPQWLDPSKALAQELAEVTGNKQRTLEILKKSLIEDQTQLKVRREIADIELEIKGAKGLAAAENVLAWEKFDLRTYEWIQGRVLEEAEKRRTTDPSDALILYQWCESVPSRLKDIATVSTFEGRLWPASANVQPSELMKLLESTAKDRQLTLF